MKLIDSSRAVLVLALVSLFGSSLGAIAAQEGESEPFPETKRGALETYEDTVAISEWEDGPVEYIMLDYEREIWDGLRIDAEREAFRQWFWDRRDLDPRDDEHEARDAFYERVARANQRFNGFPRGWRSDRGRVWVILGQPTGGLRRTTLSNYGRCSAREGEWWTYYTQNMPFATSFGEFHVIFVETRIGQFEICDPTMLGVGAYPTQLRQAFEIMNEAMIRDQVTEFDVSPDTARRSRASLPVREIEGGVEPLAVASEGWGPLGAAGAVLVPIEIPLRELLFEPVGESLRATLDVDAALVALGEEAGRTGTQQWQIDLSSESAADLGAASLRTALVLPAEAGGYAARVRIFEPLSSQARAWEEAVEVRPEGTAISPPLVGRELIQLREGGEIAVIGADPARLAPGAPFVIVSWVRGVAVDADAVRVTLADSANVETVIAPDQIAWGNQAAAGPLVVQATLPELATGRYSLHLEIGVEGLSTETVITVR